MAKFKVGKTKTKPFPREIFMRYYYQGDTTPSLVKPNGLTQGARVAIYKLHKVGKAKVKTTII